MAEIGDGVDAHAGKPLDGIRVLSLAEQYPGPFATMVLADLGADVILVERVDGGDPTRRFPGHFAALNRNKRSVCLDLKSDEGRRAMLALVDTADVLVEGFRPGVMNRLGLGEAEMLLRRPSLIYCSISGYGQTGPHSHRAGHDLSMQATAGFVTAPIGAADDDLPAPASLPLADLSSAMFAVVGVLGALLGRERSSDGGGTYVDVSMVDSLLAWRSVSLVSALNDMAPSPYPPADPGYGVFKTGDGTAICLSIAGEDHQWRALCDELGLTDLAGLTTVEREADTEALRDRLAQAILSCDWTSVSAALETRGVAISEVNDEAAVAMDEHVRAREMLVEVADGSGLTVTRQPVVFDGQPGGVSRGVPGLGEHTAQVLAEVGLVPAAAGADR